MNTDDLGFLWNDVCGVWKSQDEQPPFEVDSSRLAAAVQQSSRHSEWTVGIFEIMMTLIMVGTGMATISEPILYGTDYFQLVTALPYFGIAAFLLIGRQARRQNESRFDQSLLGLVEKSQSQIDYKIRRLNSVLWWFILPGAVGALISFAFLYDSKPVWVWFMIVAANLLFYWLVRREVRTSLQPQKAELETLRQKLTGAEA